LELNLVRDGDKITTKQETDDVLDMLRDSAEDFCQRALSCDRLRSLRGANPAFDRNAWTQMAELGWGALMAPDEHGGLNLGTAAVAIVCRKLGAVAAPEPMIETAVGAVALLSKLGGGSELLGPIVDGESIIVPVFGPVDADVFSLLEVERGSDGPTLTGTINNVPLGPDADGWLIPITFDESPGWVHVAASASGIAVESLELSDGSHDGRLLLKECRVTTLGVADRSGEALTFARNHVELASSAYLLGLSEALFGITSEYVGTRKQFGQTIGSFQVLQHRLVDLYTAIRLTNAVVAESCGIVDSVSAQEAQYCVSRARYRSCETALAMIREGVQLHGGMGYTDECDVGLYLNRALVVIARFGQSNAHLTRCARLRPTSVAAQAENLMDFRLGADAEPLAGDWNAISNEDFRGVIRQWFEAHYPAEMRNARRRPRWHECREWYGDLYARGWAAPTWPTEHGGMGLSADKFLIFVEERERWGIARTPDQGIIMVGPLLMQHGTHEQLAYYLPPALSGEHIWCQGYSEPNAGSDLASLSTSAVRDGDEFVINGQKTWTTMAQDATHMFCLVRTDTTGKPQAGISFVLIDFSTPGITVRPIRNISGDEEFCEVFFDDVRVPVANLVGGLNDGWRIAKALLSFERLFIGSPKQCQLGLSRLRELAQGRGLLQEPVFVDKFNRFAMDVADLESLYKEFADIVRRGETLGADVSLLKLWASDTVAALSEFILQTAGEGGACVGDVDFSGTQVDIMSHYYNARPTLIYGGSNEIQRNIIAKQVLNLPSR
jgi:alkylation response protein AidB-like acyl-CoA dehydrogenase